MMIQIEQCNGLRFASFVRVIHYTFVDMKRLKCSEFFLQFNSRHRRPNVICHTSELLIIKARRVSSELGYRIKEIQSIRKSSPSSWKYLTV